MTAKGWRLLVASVAVLVLTMGCARSKSPLVDRCVELASGVELPEGFAPLRGHYGFDNPEDDYHGWPRYIVSERDNMIMCYVPSQQFMMGGGSQVDEVPARTVVVNHFYVDIHEVTNAQFERYARSAKRKNLDQYEALHVECLNNHHPVRNVSWYQARDYAQWAGKYLPTEAQWEAAARGPDRRIYPWGNEEVSETTRFLCNARTGVEEFDGYSHTAPVMSFAPGVSPFGVFNMAGNVWEWCDDYYDPGRYAYPSIEDPATGLQRGPKEFGDEHYPNPLQKDIREARVGPPLGGDRVIRGGSFADPIERCRADSRASARPGTHQNNIGFRCVLTLPPMEVASR